MATGSPRSRRSSRSTRSTRSTPKLQEKARRRLQAGLRARRRWRCPASAGEGVRRRACARSLEDHRGRRGAKPPADGDPRWKTDRLMTALASLSPHCRQDRLGPARRPRQRRCKRHGSQRSAADIAALAAKGSRGAGRLVRRHRAWAAACWACRRRAAAGGKPGRGGGGQIALAPAPGRRRFGRHGIVAGQILLTLTITEERRRYLNARATIATLLEPGRRAGHQRERHRRHRRNPLRRQ